MRADELLSEDGYAVLALCSALGLPEAAAAGAGPAPFKLSEWNALARKIHESELSRPAALAGRSADELASALGISPAEGERITRLLERGSKLALELEGLFSRGLWVLTRVDEHYPAKLRLSLKQHAPSVLFGAGEVHLLARGGLAVVGSRQIDAAGTEFAIQLGRKAAGAGMPVVSGGARGTDRLAMQGALEGGGVAVGALADSLERTVRQTDVRQFLLEGKLALLTPYVPTAGFSIGAAMGRNKLIYGLADYAVVVSSEHEAGGTWAGATEALKAGWCPVFVRDAATAPKGNEELQKLGARRFPDAELSTMDDVAGWLRARATAPGPAPDLFTFAARQGADERPPPGR